MVTKVEEPAVQTPLPIELWACRNKQDAASYIRPEDFDNTITENLGTFCVWKSQEEATVALGYLWGTDCITRDEWEVVCVKG